jgi:hypothetical protein
MVMITIRKFLKYQEIPDISDIPSPRHAHPPPHFAKKVSANFQASSSNVSPIEIPGMNSADTNCVLIADILH